MRFWSNSAGLIIILVMSSLSVAQTVTKGDPQYQKIRAVGEQLKCQCEAHCSYTVAGCNMIGCSFRTTMEEEIRTNIDRGLSTGEMVNALIAKYGSELRNSPSAKGFGLFGWAMPFVALAMGLIAAPFIVKRWYRRQTAPATPSIDDPNLLSQYEREIEKEMRKLD